MKGPEYYLEKFFFRWYAQALRDFNSLEVEGLEYVPRSGRVMLIPNHSGVLGWDAVILYNEIVREKRRIPRIMAHAFWESSPFLAKMAKRFGAFGADFKQAVKFLKKNKLMILFPEAERGNFKPSVQMYQLTEFNPGFIALSLMTDTPIVPVVIMGAEENFVNLGTIDWFEEQIGVKIPLPLNLLPIPAKWKIRFLKPISLAKYGRKEVKNEKFLIEASQNIRLRIQAAIHKELVNRGVFKF